MVLSFVIVFGGVTLFVLRDYIFKGQSLGKRIFGLIVLDKSTMGVPPKRQLILKNIFLFIYPVDGILLLATGETLGNRITDTVVVSKQSIKEEQKCIGTRPTSLQREGDRLGYVNSTNIVQSEPNVNQTN